MPIIPNRPESLVKSELIDVLRTIYQNRLCIVIPAQIGKLSTFVVQSLICSSGYP